MPQFHLLAALEEVLLSYPHVTSPRLAFPLPQQNELPRLPLDPPGGTGCLYYFQSWAENQDPWVPPPPSTDGRALILPASMDN